jgi:hypothetical protein
MVFTISYPLKDGRAVTLDYGRSELLSIIHDKLEDYDGIKELPQIVSDMISRQQGRYIKEYFDRVFSGNVTTSGMRLSVYCSDKMAFEDPALIQQQEVVMPWLAGFHVSQAHKCCYQKTVLQQRPCAAWRGGPG